MRRRYSFATCASTSLRIDSTHGNNNVAIGTRSLIRVLALASCFPAITVWAQGRSAEEAARQMKVPTGFSVQLVASEPQVRQPILVKCDDRGRPWVIQYLQYPNPKGLERVKVDRYSRTVYDRIPEPPPKGPRGADRITILEDTNGDGRADKFKDFVTGLNLATGLAFGHGGVFVIQVPYLLFYPDRNRDDVPDSDPQVLLRGFGMEDAQAFANHLTWGPDGWLYGLNGSTTTCNIQGTEFQQGVWRYHPITKEFELFCEGGGNCYGLDFDRHGHLLYSSNGSHKVWHGVQGGYYWKSFGKHGQLHNPYAFGYFSSVKRDGDYRGGHVTTGAPSITVRLSQPVFAASFWETTYLPMKCTGMTSSPTGRRFRRVMAENSCLQTIHGSPRLTWLSARTGRSTFAISTTNARRILILTPSGTLRTVACIASRLQGSSRRLIGI